METWRDIAGYEGLYAVSDMGNVRNIRTDHILSSGVSQGYHYVALYKDGVRRNKQVNRLVAEAFLANPNNYPIVNHKDEIKTNNKLDNLERCSYTYNITYNGLIERRRNTWKKGCTPWNKGKTMPDSFKQKVSEGRKRYLANRIKMEEHK